MGLPWRPFRENQIESESTRMQASVGVVKAIEQRQYCALLELSKGCLAKSKTAPCMRSTRLNWRLQNANNDCGAVTKPQSLVFVSVLSAGKELEVSGRQDSSFTLRGHWLRFPKDRQTDSCASKRRGGVCS